MNIHQNLSFSLRIKVELGKEKGPKRIFYPNKQPTMLDHSHLFLSPYQSHNDYTCIHSPNRGYSRKGTQKQHPNFTQFKKSQSSQTISRWSSYHAKKQTVTNPECTKIPLNMGLRKSRNQDDYNGNNLKDQKNEERTISWCYMVRKGSCKAKLCRGTMPEEPNQCHSPYTQVKIKTQKLINGSQNP